ncbi:tetratricopeptide repeat protein [Dactylosporangium sp. CA-092794]|uniref:tetratricopeptide repeat protein n=1 Tax=Dactylosporangium sp. CA-092794 TaxID=3239929 RepID=UPI003D900717
MRVRMILTVVLAAALLFGLGAVAGRTGGTPAAVWKESAETARPAAKLPAAIAAYQERLRKVPGDWTTWAALGSAYLDQARVGADPSYYPKAEGALQQSLQVRPGNPGALAGLGALANARHDFAGARTYAQQALAADPYSDTAYGVLADAETQLGHPAEATDAVQHMLDLRPGLASYTRASYDLEQHGRRTEAIALMRQALAAATEPADIAFCHQHLAALAWAAGDLATAAGEVGLGLAADDTVAGLWQLRSRLDAADGRLDAALADLDKVVSRTPTVDALIEQARMLTAAGRDPGPALRLAEAAHQLFVANGGTDDLGGSALALASGKVEDAVRLAEQEWGRRQFAEVADAVAWSLNAAGRPAEALPFIQRAEALGQLDPMVAYHHGMIALATGDRVTAKLQLQLALSLNPHFSPIDAPAAQRTLTTLEP